MKTVYNKLIRDRIPEIIESNGQTCICKVLDEQAYLAALDAKLSEELAEYQQDHSLEELADLLEVIHAVIKARGSTLQNVEAIRAEKARQRGGFDKRLYLLHTEMSDS